MQPSITLDSIGNAADFFSLSFKCRLGRPEQIFYGGEIRPVIQYRDDIGQALLHSYEVYNSGPWRVPYLSVVVSWPYQVENGKPVGKWLLYMDEKPTVDGGMLKMAIGKGSLHVVCSILVAK